MFSIFKKKVSDIPEALSNQTIGGQSVLYRLFLEALDCNNLNIRKLEITYFAASIMTFSYLRFGKQPNRNEILDQYTHKFLTKCIASLKEDLSFDEVVKEYQSRFSEYSSMLPLLLAPEKSATKNPSATLLLHAFECVTQSSARDKMPQIVAASGFIDEFLLDHIDFIKVKL